MKNQRIVQEKTDFTKYFIAIFIITTIITLIVLQKDAIEQNEELLEDYTTYNESLSLLNEGDSKIVIMPLEELHSKYSEDFNLTYILAYAYLENGNNEEALKMYNKSLKLNPYFVENENFMYQYAISLTNMEEYKSAEEVIDRLLKLPIDDTFKNTVIDLKNTISRMQGASI